MRFRKLRIAWSVGCGIGCLLLIVLWVRSYFAASYIVNEADLPQNPFGSQTLTVSSSWGIVCVESYPDFMWPHIHGWHSGTDDVTKSSAYKQKGLAITSQFKWQTVRSVFVLQAPYWCVVLVIGSIGALPWAFRSRFSLRTLLVGTTLVAAILGAVVWAARK